MSKIESTEIGAVVNGVKLTAIISPALDAWDAETNACFGPKGKDRADKIFVETAQVHFGKFRSACQERLTSGRTG